MPLSQDAVRSLFAHLEAGDGSAFFDHVDDDVNWTVEGHHPLAGRYRGKAEFRAHTFERLGKVLLGGARYQRADQWRLGDRRTEVVGDGGQRPAIRQQILLGNPLC